MAPFERLPSYEDCCKMAPQYTVPRTPPPPYSTTFVALHHYDPPPPFNQGATFADFSHPTFTLGGEEMEMEEAACSRA
jgi:hypothetical protein